jgi:hypothetical protein
MCSLHALARRVVVLERSAHTNEISSQLNEVNSWHRTIHHRTSFEERRVFVTVLYLQRSRSSNRKLRSSMTTVELNEVLWFFPVTDIDTSMLEVWRRSQRAWFTNVATESLTITHIHILSLSAFVSKLISTISREYSHGSNMIVSFLASAVMDIDEQ